MKIPLHRENATPSTQVPGVTTAMQDPSAEVNMWKSVGRAGATVAAIGTKYANRMNSEKAEAEVARYNADRQIRTNAIGAEISKMSDPDEIQSRYAEWREQESQILSESKLGRPARKAVENSSQMHYADSDNMARKINANAEVAQMDRSYIDLENLGINGGSHELPTGQILVGDDLVEYAAMKRVDTGGYTYEQAQDVIRNAPSKRMYRKSGLEGASLAEAFKSGLMSPDKYMENLKDLRDRVRKSGMNGEHMDKLDYNFTYQIANVAGTQSTAAKSMEDKLSKDIIAGKLTPEWKEIAVSKYGEKATENIEKIIRNSLGKVSATNENVRKGLDMIKQMRTTPMTYTDIVEFASKSCGEFGEEIRELAAITAGEYIESGASIAYSKYVPPSMFSLSPWSVGENKKYVAPYTGWVADVHDDIIDASRTTEDMTLIQGYQRELINFYHKNPKPEAKEIDDFKRELLGDHFKSFTQELQNPITTPEGKSVQVVTEYKEGDTRTHPETGVTYTMKDGQWR